MSKSLLYMEDTCHLPCRIEKQIPPNEVEIYSYEGIINKDKLTGKENVTHLDIAFGKIDHICEDFFLGTPDLKQLIINGNEKFPKLGKDFFQFYPNLTFFRVYNNRNLEIDEDAFSELKHLKTLMLDNQKYKRISKDLFKGLDLTELSLVDCKIESISSDAFQTLPNLRKLYLSYNKLTNIEAGTFENLEKLDNLWLHFNKLKNINWDEFDRLPSLEYLDLAKNKDLTTYDIEKIVNLFPKLKKINLSIEPTDENNLGEFAKLGIECVNKNYGTNSEYD